MQTGSELHSLLRNLLDHTREITVLWQVAVLLASIAIAWFLERLLAKRMASRVAAGEQAALALDISPRSMSRLMFPIFGLILLVVGRWALSHWYPIHLLNVAVPLLFALALIRITVYVMRRVFSTQEWLHPWERFIGWAIWIGLALYITGLLPEILQFLDE